MDEEVIKYKVDGVEKAVTNLKDLKTALKQAKDEQVAASIKFGEGSKEYIKASQNLSKLKDKVEDLADSTKSLKGSGIERSASGFSQLGEGLRNLDLDKVKVGLTAIKSALAATGIMLLVQGVTYLVQNFDELSKGSGIVAKALQAVGGVLNMIKDGVSAVTDALGLTNSELDKQGESIKTYADTLNSKLASTSKSFDDQIKAAKAAGHSTVQLEIAKQQAIIDTNVLIVKQIEAFVRAGGVYDAEKRKQVEASLDVIRSAVTEEKVIELNDHKDKLDRHKKSLEEKQKIRDLFAASNDEFEKENEKDAAINNAKESALKESLSRQAAEKAKAYDDDVKAAKAAVDEQTNNVKKASETQKQINKSVADQSFSVAKQSIQNQQALVDLFFSMKLSKAKNDSAEHLKLAKRQFQINKALQIQTAIISGIQGVINALTAQSVIPEPYGTILKVITAAGIGAAAAINIAKIASTQFNDSGGDSGGAAAPASTEIGSVATAAPPTINTPANTPPDTKIGNDGKNLSVNPPVVKAIVVEKEMTDKQKQVAKLEGQGKF